MGCIAIIMFDSLAELDSYEDRVCEVQRLVDQHIPAANKKMLELLLGHLENVALKSDKNMMTISNLGKDSSATRFAFRRRFNHFDSTKCPLDASPKRQNLHPS